MNHPREHGRLEVLWGILLSCALGCGPPPAAAPEPIGAEVAAAPDAAPETRLLRAPPLARHAPSMVDVEGPIDVALLADVETCAECHQGAALQHASGPHAHASFDNPWYRAAVDDLRLVEGFPASRHCAGCHDPLLLLSGAIDRPIEPGDPFTTSGVTCMVCHSVTRASTDGNGSYTLTDQGPLIPDPNDEEEVARHRARMAPDVLRTPVLCTSCHRGFLHPESGTSAFFPGIDEPGAWRGSAYAGQRAQRIDDIPERDCRGCHMAPEAGGADFAIDAAGAIASHRFAGGHSALASALGDAAQLEAVVARQRSAASIDAVIWLDGAPLDAGAVLEAGAAVAIDVVVRNVGTGHRFPGGIRDGRDHHVVLEITDARGRRVLSAGLDPADGRTFFLRTEIVDDEGTLETAHRTRRFRALVSDRTIAPRDALLARYELVLPAGLSMPLTARAELAARRHRSGLVELTCGASGTERGLAFLAASPVRIDGCAEEPEVSLAVASVVFSGAGATPLTAARLYADGLALLHGLSERLDAARPALMAALRLEDRTTERAAILVALAELEGRQGRTEAALGWADQAQALVGAHPAIDRARGRALAAVWRWREAEVSYARVAEAARMDTEAYRDLARARGSLRDDRGALAAAVLGLALAPRDEGLLRSQALALESLADPRGPAAREAFLSVRRPDDEMALRFACDHDPVCAASREALPRFVIDDAAER